MIVYNAQNYIINFIKKLFYLSYSIQKECYNMMLMYHRSGKHYSVSEVRQLLSKIGFGNVFINQKIDTRCNFIMSVTQRLKDIYIQSWSESISLSNKCFYYRLFKTYFIMETYLTNSRVKNSE